MNEHFAQSYAEARQRFLAAADAADLDVHSHAHPMLGRDGEPLAMDIARFGARDAHTLLLVTSGCHGVEGFCGSGVQVALLRDASWHRAAADAGVAVLYIHALNPYGFSWWRRTTHENVDLNRNFHDFSKPLPHNELYDEIAALLVPPAWPPSPEVQQRIAQVMQQWGLDKLQAVVSGGQYEHPKGCSTAATTRPGATRRYATCCRSRALAAPGSAGSTCTRVSARAAMANASSPAATTRRRWPARARGGDHR